MLFKVTCDTIREYYVDAKDFAQAALLWDRYCTKVCHGNYWTPDSIKLVSEKDVIRQEDTK